MDARKDIGHDPASPWLWIALIWLSIGTFDASDTVFSMRAEGHHHAWVSLFFTLLLVLAAMGTGKSPDSAGWGAGIRWTRNPFGGGYLISRYVPGLVLPQPP